MRVVGYLLPHRCLLQGHPPSILLVSHLNMSLRDKETPHIKNDISLDRNIPVTVTASENERPAEQLDTESEECDRGCPTDSLEANMIIEGRDSVSNVSEHKMKPAEFEHVEHAFKQKLHSETHDSHLDLLHSLSSKLSNFSKEFSKRQDKLEQMLDAQEKLLHMLYGKVETLENRICSHALLPYSVIVPNILSYTKGNIGEEWRSPDFYTGTYSNKSYKLQLSVVPNSLHMHNKEKALSARLLIRRGEKDDKLTWPFHARFNLIFVDPTNTEKPYEVIGRHTWESPNDESSMQFKACITHNDLLRYVKFDGNLHLNVDQQ